jgi:NADPH-dependent 2,4-dienoyl-CoA reductase/sulfur reductase-like enzyme
LSTIVVVGAGPAGTSAAATLVEAGLRPIVIDEAPSSGGQIYRRQPPGFRRPLEALYGHDAAKARRLHETFDRLGTSIDHRPGTLVFDLTPETLWTLDPAGRIEAIAWERLILATGAMDRVIPLPGWTLPGVFTLGGAQIALKFQACAVGRRVAFLGTGPLLYLVAFQYAKAGVEVVAVLDTAPLSGKFAALADLWAGGETFLHGIEYAARLRLRRIPVLEGVRRMRFEGAERLSAVIVEHRGRERRFECDAAGFGFWLKPETQLHDLAGVPFRYHDGQQQWLPVVDAAGRTPVAHVYAAGDGAEIRGADVAQLTGMRAALALLEDMGQTVSTERVAGLERAIERFARFRRGLERAFPFPAELEGTIADDTIVCRCERITAGEVRAAVQELGAGDVNRAKAFSRLGMGRCQGRVCGLAGARITAACIGRPIAEVGRLRCQAPIKPIPVTAEPADARAGEQVT